FLFLMVDAAEFKPGDSVLGVDLNGLGKIPFGIGPLLFLRIIESPFVGLLRILRCSGSGDAEREALNVLQRPNDDGSDIRIVHGPPEPQHDGFGYKSREISANLTTGEVAFVTGGSASGRSACCRVSGDAGIEKHAGIRIRHDKAESSLGIRVP